MLELFSFEMIKASVSLGKEMLGNRIKEINNDLLEKKKLKNEKEKQKKLHPNEISKLILSTDEKIDANLILSEDEMFHNLKSHINEVQEWSKEASFKDMRGGKKISDIYVELDIYLMPLRTHISYKERSATIPFHNAIFQHQSHCVILGQPGAGKTTSMKNICASFFNGTKLEPFNFPILIRCRDLNNIGKSLKAALFTLINFKISLADRKRIVDSPSMEEWEDEIRFGILDKLSPLIVIDGFDELPSHEEKEEALSDIRLLIKKLNNAKIILTCRTGEFNYNLNNTDIFEISSLNPEQVSVFVHRWIGDDKKANKFIEDISNSPFSDTAIKPLTLAHLCAIYERIGSIPDRPKVVYKKIVGLMLEEWDQQRFVKRVSRYATFESDRKFEFLANLAHYLTVTARTTVFTKEQLEDAYIIICHNFGLPESDSVLTANELESHTGLFLETGYQQYEFVHKSIQEYLAAEYLVKLPSLDSVIDHIELLGAELAIATSISSNPSIYFTYIVLAVFNRANLTDSFYNAFVSRLIQESPDFYSSDEMVLASFSLLSNHQDDEKYIYLMERLLAKNSLEIIIVHYRMEMKYNNDTLLLRRKKIHESYKLPDRLHIPKGLYSQKLLQLYKYSIKGVK